MESLPWFAWKSNKVHGAVNFPKNTPGGYLLFCLYCFICQCAYNSTATYHDINPLWKDGSKVRDKQLCHMSREPFASECPITGIPDKKSMIASNIPL